MTYYFSKQYNRVYDFNHEPKGEEWERLSNYKGRIVERQQAIDDLQKIFSFIPTGEKKIYTVLRSVSKSGMSRVIDFYTIENNKPLSLTHLIGKACDYRMAKNGGLVVKGCGMDMGFHVVYVVSSILHSGDRGGYEIKHEWM